MAIRNRFTTLAAAAALFIGFAGPASAGDLVHLQTIGHWEIRANNRHCDAKGTFRDGTSLEFVLNAKGAMMIFVENPKWSINKSDDYEVVMQVDRARAETFQAHGEDTWVSWQIPPTEASFNLLSYGRTLAAQIGHQVVSYDLVLSEPAIKAIVQCIAPRMAVANPFSGTAPQASAPPAANPPASRGTSRNSAIFYGSTLHAILTPLELKSGR